MRQFFVVVLNGKPSNHRGKHVKIRLFCSGFLLGSSYPIVGHRLDSMVASRQMCQPYLCDDKVMRPVVGSCGWLNPVIPRMVAPLLAQIWRFHPFVEFAGSLGSAGWGKMSSIHHVQDVRAPETPGKTRGSATELWPKPPSHGLFGLVLLGTVASTLFQPNFPTSG